MSRITYIVENTLFENLVKWGWSVFYISKCVLANISDTLFQEKTNRQTDNRWTLRLIDLICLEVNSGKRWEATRTLIQAIPLNNNLISVNN